MRIIHGSNYSFEERKKYKPLILQNIVDSIVRLVNAMKQFNKNFITDLNDDNFTLMTICHQKLQLDLVDWNQNLKKYYYAITSIWDDESIKITYQRRNKFYLIDSIE